MITETDIEKIGKVTSDESGDGPEHCKHLDTFDPGTTSDPELRVLWCCDCGALLFPDGRVIAPRVFKAIFACPMCAQAPTAEPVCNVFIKGSFDYSCKACGFKPDTGSDYIAATLELWNKAVWKIICGDVLVLRRRYKEALQKLQEGLKK